MKEINSKIIGQLKQDSKFEDWWVSKPIKIPFFTNTSLAIIFMDFVPESDSAFVQEADNALQNFLSKGQTDRLKISELVYKNSRDFLNTIACNEQDEHLCNIQDKNEIWNYVTPSEMYLTRRPYNDMDIYVVIACECEWEQEHGLQLVFRQGKKITRVSGQDGHLTEADALDKPDSEDELLKKFNENTFFISN